MRLVMVKVQTDEHLAGIVVVNDDSVDTPDMARLRRAAEAVGCVVTVLAPDSIHDLIDFLEDDNNL